MSAMSTTVMSTLDHVGNSISSYHANMTASSASPTPGEPDNSQAPAVLAFANDNQGPMSLNSSHDQNNHKESTDVCTTTIATNDLSGKNINPEKNPFNVDSSHKPLDSDLKNVVAAHVLDSETKHSPEILLAEKPGAVVAQHNNSPDRTAHVQEHLQQQQQQEQNKWQEKNQLGELVVENEVEDQEMVTKEQVVKDEFTSSFSVARECIRDLKELRGSQTDAEWITTADKIQAIMTQMQKQWREMDKTRKLMAKNKGNNHYHHDHSTSVSAAAGTATAGSRRAAKRESSLSKSDSDYSSSGGSSSRSSRRRL